MLFNMNIIYSIYNQYIILGYNQYDIFNMILNMNRIIQYINQYDILGYNQYDKSGGKVIRKSP